MRNLNFTKILMSALLACSVMFVSCDEDEETLTAPEAGFTSSVDGKTVTLTNSTVGEEVTYLWDFGDGNTSTEESTSHTFEANGAYVIKLTATNEGGEDDSSEAFEIINIKIDGDFTEWEEIASPYSYTEEESGTIADMKVENLNNNKLYIYLKLTSDFGGVVNMFFDADNDSTTGHNHYLWSGTETTGFEYLIDGSLISTGDATIYADNLEGLNTDWCWTPFVDDACPWPPIPVVEAGTGSEIFSVSDAVVEGEYTHVEFSIDLDKFEGVSTEAVTFGMTDVNNITWSGYFGHIPATGDGIAAYTHVFK